MNIIFQNNRTDRFIYAEKTHTKSNLLSLSFFLSFISKCVHRKREKTTKNVFFFLFFSAVMRVVKEKEKNQTRHKVEEKQNCVYRKGVGCCLN